MLYMFGYMVLSIIVESAHIAAIYQRAGFKLQIYTFTNGSDKRSCSIRWCSSVLNLPLSLSIWSNVGSRFHNWIDWLRKEF